MGNQYPQIVKELAPQIHRVRDALCHGARPSLEANRLHAEGIGAMKIMLIFMEATGIRLASAKAFSQWWGDAGVTDPDAFDAYAAELDLQGMARLESLGELREGR